MASKKKKSKRRSDTKSPSQPEPIFFVDRNLGSKVFPEILKRAGLAVEIHDDHFSPVESDETWLREVGKRGWIVLTSEKAIRYKSVETQALMQAGVRMFVLPGNLKAQDSAAIFMKALPRVKRFLSKHSSHFIATLYKSGEIKLRFP